MKRFSFKLLILAAMLALAGCQGGTLDDLTPKAERELSRKVQDRMKAKGMAKNSPIHIRLFKDEHVVEIWKQKSNGKYDMIANYNICAWSGTLGPKFKEGDRQAPEGFYSISAANMNPASKYFLSINTGFPNTYDRALGRYGTDLMIHGACSSSGCYSVSDASVQEIFAFARDAFEGGQREFTMELMPFRMTPEKMAVYRNHKDFAFWQMIKEGYDYFEMTKMPPKVGFCEKKYVFNRSNPDGSPLDVNGACPPPAQTAFSATYASYQLKYDAAFAKAAKKYEFTPYPVIMGGKSRPTDKQWDTQPVKKEKSAQLPKPLRPGDPGAIQPGTSQPVGVQTTAAETAPAANAASTQPAATALDAPVATLDTQPEAQAAATPVPVPQASASVPEVATAPVEPVKKKRRLWPFGNDS